MAQFSFWPRRPAANAPLWAVCLLACSGLAAAQERLTVAQQKLFEAKIRPVLVEHCYECHSAQADEPAGGLLLDTRSGLRAGGDSGPAIVAGKPDSSLLLLAMQHRAPELIMPPRDYGDKLPDAVLADFERWIRSGAPDPREDGPQPAKAGADAAKQWWAWQPRQATALPTVQHADWPTQELDYFVLASLEAAGLTPAERADRVTLVRRLAFDLTGLPPAVEELQTFALADQPQPLELLVDQYLSREQYGERLGRLWLDVARYAESTGKDVNITYPNAWRYRDYVIDAFNQDLPFDQFILEQLAGDLLEHQDEAERGRRMIATGFLAVGTKGLNERNPRQFASDVADEQIDAWSQAFLATTLACARCHDHKFDPITQRDYTAVAGIFLSTNTHYGTTGGVGGTNRSTLLELPPLFAESGATVERSPAQLSRIREQLERLEEQLAEYRRERLAGESAPEAQANALRLRQQQVRLQMELDAFDASGDAKPLAMGVSDKAPATRMTRFRGRLLPAGGMGNRFVSQATTIIDSPLLIRGEIDKPGEVVPRGLPEFLARDVLPRIDRDESGRLQLATWIASEANPLTARVIVNRVWSWLLGEGLVSSVDNFGTSGDTPIHPALLDHLANRFVDQGWSIKTLVREIVLSSTYQQSSQLRQDAFQIDPDNRLLWRAHRRALDAEQLRDALLMASGDLDGKRPAGSLISQAGDGPVGQRRGFGIGEATISEADPNYRSVYLPVPRGVLPEALELFDFADNSAVNGSRDLTIVPSQALYWMNNSAVETRCRKLARNALQYGITLNRNEPSRRFRGRQAQANAELMFEYLTLRVLSRPALPTETEAALRYAQQLRQTGKSADKIWLGIARSLVSSADFRFLN